MTRRRPIDGGDVLIAVALLALLALAAGQCVGAGIDWLDRRACRVAGGRVVEEGVLDREWRCLGGERAP